MGLKTKLGKLEQRAKQHHATPQLIDGTEACYNIEYVLAAVEAAALQEEHWLLPHLLRMNTEPGLPGLIKALVASGEKHGRGSVG